MADVPDQADIPSPWRALVVIPTYNEAESLEGVVAKVLASPASVDVLVVDDSSPDGTGELADRLAAADSRVSVLHRSTKDGLGRAYLSGFAWGLEHDYEVLVEMDADGSHPVDSVGALIAAVRSGETHLAIGSRWIPGGTVIDWPTSRKALSKGANHYARLVLGIPVRDSTSGFRAYRADLLRSLHLDDVHSRGYCFQIDMTLRSVDGGARVVEVPIAFRERQHGASKMTGDIVGEAMLRVTLWGVRRRLRLLLGRPPR
jgi:dolichol-phosphate mannosyltransferase